LRTASSSTELSFIGPLDDVIATTKTAAAEAGMVDSRDINIVRLFHKYMATGQDASALIKEIESREQANAIFKQLLSKLYGKNEIMAKKMYGTHAYKPTQYDCHREIIALYNDKCPEQFTDYSLKHTKIIVNLCEDMHGDVEKIGNALREVCH
jgi:hypothetical protein